ncbi:phosphatidylinositol-4-phosphate 5-kinase [Ordospora colligata]|uniref:Phosphatidylinositol-4-phosphate 5-kinase n=1 Tax=Ordospora colligata OC4 TaxID=1354746 RepID=A0A0B2UGE7_9MICR|nr:phosphatidylinositol-4-phosphate 5-kinase [Ordospora colligata OC4]KHN70151.1 phosphatidylinositol-4-phosphate 5-kinase [Ordospora colligata OC4]TBU16533.1 phosphatidylinositol-4-phosphate 5-kinase [Ordospora colligata]TBU16574.1 phosphatidylinositol-4-phosphate 5-kinase [Ordospora colligata]TBU19147.1 phosphatidylinositol-4-phosphate 5-kinase [Ordospora colligata]
MQMKNAETLLNALCTIENDMENILVLPDHHCLYIDTGTAEAYNIQSFVKVRKVSGINSLGCIDSQYIINTQIQGKSGSLVFFTKDFKYAIKTIRKSELSCICQMAPEYSTYIEQNPNSLLCRILGCYSLKTCISTEYFIIMKNILEGCSTPDAMHADEVYDLKGVNVCREGQSLQNLKETNWIKNNKKIEIHSRPVFVSQMRRDLLFLNKHNVMDYSLLVCFKSVPTNRSHGESYLPNAEDQKQHVSDVHFGIIDILTQWNFRKRTERLLNLFCCNSSSSCIDPDAYMTRFLAMVESDFLC